MESRAASHTGALGRLAYWSIANRRRVLVSWILLVLGAGALLPSLEHSLAGSGMEHTGSDSVKVREIARAENPLLASSAINVVMHGKQPYAKDPAFRRAARAVHATLAADPNVKGVAGPTASRLISRDGRTVVVSAGSGGNTRDMIRAADRLRTRVQKAAGPTYTANLSGLSANWADFNKEHKEQSLRSETYAFPVTLIVLAIAFGSLMAAGLPLLMTASALGISAGLLYVITQVTDVSIWAMTFVLIFAMALGVDYALFLVMRFRDALNEHADPIDAAAMTMDTAGRAIAFSGGTVLVALAPCFLIPIPMPHSIALGTMLAVVLVLTVAFTVLPVLLAGLGTRIDLGRITWRRGSTSAPGDGPGRMRQWGETICNRPGLIAAGSLAVLIAFAIPLAHLQIGLPGESVQTKDAPSRLGAEQARAAFGDTTLAPVTVVTTPAQTARVIKIMKADRDLIGVQRVQRAPGAPHKFIQASFTAGSDSQAVDPQIERLRSQLPAGTLVGGAPAELHDVKNAMANSAPMVIGMILALAFVLLFIAVRAPLLALAGTLTSLASTAAAFGITVSVFQDGHLHELFGLQPQGYLDFWAPVFFFAMIFAIAMDYTVFYVSAAREAWDRTGDTREALASGMDRSGPVIIAAAIAMIAVYGSFAICPAVGVKEMGTILGLSVLFDAFFVRLALLPALMRLAGKWIWWEPQGLTRYMPPFSLAHHAPHTEQAPASPEGALSTR